MKLWQIIVDLLFPHFCCGCGAYNTILCKKCFEQIEFRTLPELQLDTKYLDSLQCVGIYSGVLKKLIKTLKYDGVQDAGKICGMLMYHCCKLPVVEALVPVPLHKIRKNERGFNQAEEIALGISNKSSLPLIKLLERNKHLTAQARISNKEERKNRLANVFQISPHYTLPDKILPKSVLLVDDVTTTGTTLNECAKILKMSGFKQVHSLVLAHGK